MICPRCGWLMQLLSIREHSHYIDNLYQCKCGTAHLHIVPKQEIAPFVSNASERLEDKGQA